MIQDINSFLNLITVNKDQNLGKWDIESTPYMLDHYMKTLLQTELPQRVVDGIIDGIKSIDMDTLEHTNVELHFTVVPESMVQYISPYNKTYHVGNSWHGIQERILYLLRPEHIHLGYINEVMDATGRNHHLVDENDHKFGSCDNYFNIICLHTYEYDKTAGTDASTVHIAFLVPPGNEGVLHALAEAHRAYMASKSPKKEGKGREKKSGRKKNRKNSQH